MNRFTVRLPAQCPAHEALGRVLDLRVHNQVIPLTTITPARAFCELRPGSSFVARTAVGRFGFDDPMVVEHIGMVPGRAVARLRKEGRAIRGQIRVDCRDTEDGGSSLTWHQDVHLPWWPRSLHWMATPVLRAGYRRVLRQLLARPHGT